MFNIYDQANKVTYPDYKSGYWQRQVSPDELPARDIYTFFTTNFGTELDSINQWGSDDRMGGLFLFGKTLYLARVHDGGKDSRGRPQRWTLFVWRENDVSGDTPRALDLARWLADPQWPADSASVPLPLTVPDDAYPVPFVAAAPIADSIFPQGGRLNEQPRSLDNAQTLWAAWSSASESRRAKNGFLIFAAIGGAFKCLHELDLRESGTYLAEVAAEKRRIEEEERRCREADKRRWCEEEEAKLRRKREAEERLKREDEAFLLAKAERRHRLWTLIYFGFYTFLGFLCFLLFILSAVMTWEYLAKQDFLKKRPAASEIKPTPPAQPKSPASPNGKPVTPTTPSTTPSSKTSPPSGEQKGDKSSSAAKTTPASQPIEKPTPPTQSKSAVSPNDKPLTPTTPSTTPSPKTSSPSGEQKGDKHSPDPKTTSNTAPPSGKVSNAESLNQSKVAPKTPTTSENNKSVKKP